MIKWEEFFKDHEDCTIVHRSVHVDESVSVWSTTFTIEELYQAIKERLKHELCVDIQNIHHGYLIENPNKE